MKYFRKRFASSEEKNNMKKASLFIGLTIIALVFVFFIGIPLLGKFTAFITDLKKSNKPLTSQDTTPPSPPYINTFSDFTNQQNVTISGTGEPGATVKLAFNGIEQSNLIDKDGKFSFNMSLDLSANTFSVIAMDAAGNQSQRTKEYVINFDTKAPDLNITSPSDSAQFFGSNQRQETIKGTSEPGVGVTINERIIFVDDTGNFQYTTTLNDGENKFNVKVTDQAGNTTEKSLTLNFTP